jgi:hypothetical protein
MRHALGRDPWEKQVEMAQAVFLYPRVAVAGCVSSSKTHGAAAIVLAWLFGWGPGARVLTLAPSYRQVDLNLWGEIPRAVHGAPIPLGGRLYETTQYKIENKQGLDWYALGFSTKNPEMLHGIHGPHDLVIVDDAHAVPEPMFEELENMDAGGQTHFLLLYNPMRLSGTTYACSHGDRANWRNIRIPFSCTPNAKAGKVVIPGMLKQETVDRWAMRFGKNSSFYRVKVDALEPLQEADTLIPLEWCELAKAREVPDPTADCVRAYGQDVARFGDDDSVRCEIWGRRTLPLAVRHGNDTMQTAGELLAAQRERPGVAAVDVIGLGSGVYDRCVEAESEDGGIPGAEFIAVNVSEKSIEADEAGKQRFVNLRSEVWWYGREALNPDNPECVTLPEDDELIGELSSAKFKHMPKGIQVESKEEMKKRLGKSPDRADAFNLAVHARRQGGGSGDLIHVMDAEELEVNG